MDPNVMAFYCLINHVLVSSVYYPSGSIYILNYTGSKSITEIALIYIHER